MCSLRCGVEALGLEDVHVDEVLLHLVEFVAAHGVDVATLELLLQDLRHRDLTQVCAHTQQVPIHDEGVLLIGKLAGVLSLNFLLGGEFLGE